MPLPSSFPTLQYDHGCVLSLCPMASAIGAGVLRQGGNCVDAAVATALALAVTLPQAGNLGGGGMLIIKRPGDIARFLDFRETAPASVTVDHMFEAPKWQREPGGPVHPRPRFQPRNPPDSSNASLESDPALDSPADPISSSSNWRLSVPDTALSVGSMPSVFGALSVGVPGTVAGLAEVLERYGTWSWHRLIQPAIDLAEGGILLTTKQALTFELYNTYLKRFRSTRRCFTRDGRPPLPGTIFRQPDLAATLRTLSQGGPRAFYTSEIADKIIKQVEAEGGALTREDLARYRAVWRPPLQRSFMGREIYAAGLPSGGGLVMLTTLGLLEGSRWRDLQPNSAERAALLLRAFRVAFALRGELAGDPDALSPEECAEVKTQAERIFGSDDLEELEKRLFPLDPHLKGAVAAAAGPATTHFCVLDPMGGAVSLTYSLNTNFGSKLVVADAGFLLNNSLDDFHMDDNKNWYGLIQGARNGLAAGRRPVSSMTPCIVTSGDSVELIVGGAGGPRIPTMLTQVMLSLLADECSVMEAVRRPRIHHQGVPDVASVEKELSPDVVAALQERGIKVERTAAIGLATAIRRDPSNDALSASLNPRPVFSVESPD